MAHQVAPVQASLFEDKNTDIIDEILKTDLDTLSPLKALNFLHHLMEMITKRDYH
jgi:hypothetical protein